MCLGCLSGFGGCRLGCSQGGWASLEDGVPAGVPPNADRVTGEAPLTMATELSFSVRLVNADPHRPRGPDRLVLNSPVIPMKWDQPSTGTLVSVPDVVQSIINC